MQTINWTCWKNDADRHAQCRFATILQFIKNTSTKHNKAKHNKMRCLYVVHISNNVTFFPEHFRFQVDDSLDMEPRYEGPTVYNYQNLSNSILKEGDLFYVNLPQQQWKSKSTTIISYLIIILFMLKTVKKEKILAFLSMRFNVCLRHQSEKYKYKIVYT